MGLFKGFGKRSNTITYTIRHDSNGYYQVGFRMGSKGEDLFAVDQLEDAESAVDELSRKLGESPSSSLWETRDFIKKQRSYHSIRDNFQVDVVDNGNVMTTYDPDTGRISYNTYLGISFDSVEGIPVEETLAVRENEHGFWVIDHVLALGAIDWEGYRTREDAIFAASRYINEINEPVDELFQLLEDSEYKSYLLDLRHDILDELGYTGGKKKFKRERIENTNSHRNQDDLNDTDSNGEVLKPSKSLERHENKNYVKTTNLAEGQHFSQKLDRLIGLSVIKNEVHSMVQSFNGQKRLEEQGIHTKKPLLHMVFEGPPGTGKTEVARLMAEILHSFGYIEENKCIEVSRKDLVGRYIGDTAKDTDKWIQRAKGGVLFIDEAYALANGGENDYGSEAIEVILKAMEDLRDEIVFIFAGYSFEMKKFLDMNPGLESRIGKFFQFPDYTPKEMKEITLAMLKSSSFRLEKESEEAIEVEINRAAQKGVIAGNARWARSFSERILEQHRIYISHEHVNEVTVIQPETVKKAGTNRLAGRDQEGMKGLRDEALMELENMVGLDDLKNEVRRILNFIYIQKEREKKGLKSELGSLHMAFTGPPGTGKTTVARIIGKFLSGSGVLEKGHFVEATRSDFVGKYVGHTSERTKETFEKAKGGVLFIDEAYSLVQGERDDFGQEAVDTLIALMENHRKEVVVILAGYDHEIDQLMESNPGFDSRIRNRFTFPSLDAEALYFILEKGLRDRDYKVPGETKDAILTYIKGQMTLYQAEVAKGNGRWARNQVDKIVLNQSDRLAAGDDSDLEVILPEDVLGAAFYERDKR
ncbi:hypothetical protein AS034_02060 [[Bacillus] enclensis]|uniref:AAA+-type ATPase, SpoVK/Ycf46/Vps4 family n=1 Tax=[Bacillus] enclensis TaxID=1402860 RepID=A0A0V8HPY0_9BACI|nr:AAA family ATPase [[Bacillus] enclensis]KSU64643.1 hypothetical protein AS034_02060 [[Bacillus] enclensis]SCB77589.1 AAA+-type ATPase, SpoVK/Ycf46/Vps4 family [[Bacillus] enclensis]